MKKTAIAMFIGILAMSGCESGGAQCGNGRLDPGEECDGALFDEDLDYAVNCGAIGKVYDESRVKCSASCEIDSSDVCIDKAD